jgi:hypothetical protein
MTRRLSVSRKTPPMASPTSSQSVNYPTLLGLLRPLAGLIIIALIALYLLDRL